MPPILTTARLELRTMADDDASALYELNLNPRVRRYLGEPPLADRAAALGVIRDVLRPQYEAYGVGRLAVTRRERPSFVGWCGLKYRDDTDDYDLGFRFFECFWGQGYATEASRAVLDDFGARDAWAGPRGASGAPRVVGEADVDNVASRRVLEKVGLVLERLDEDEDGPVARYVLPFDAWRALSRSAGSPSG